MLFVSFALDCVQTFFADVLYPYILELLCLFFFFFFSFFLSFGVGYNTASGRSVFEIADACAGYVEVCEGVWESEW